MANTITVSNSYVQLNFDNGRVVYVVTPLKEIVKDDADNIVITGQDGQAHPLNYEEWGYASQSDLIADLTVNSVGLPIDYKYQVALGRRTDAVTWNKFGYNSDIDIGTETLWSAGGTFSPMTAAATLSVVSTSVNDDSGGTGANSVVIYGVDASWESQIEVVTLNGTTPVITSNTWLGVNRMSIYLAGSGQANAGVISATATGGGSTLQAQMPTGEGTSQQAIFFVGNNKQLLADFLQVNTEKTSGGASPKVRFKGWVFSAVSNAKYLVFNNLIDSTVENTIQVTPSQPFIISEKSILYFEATTDTNDTFASCRFSGVLISDIGA